MESAKAVTKVMCAAGLVFTASQAEASCLNPNADSRLRTLCVAETLAGSAVTLNDALILDTLLKREGYYRFNRKPTLCVVT